MEIDEKAVLPLFGSLCTQRVPASQVLWGEVSHKQFRTKLIHEIVQNVELTPTRVERGI
jgi:hypothetical protein